MNHTQLGFMSDPTTFDGRTTTRVANIPGAFSVSR